MSRTQDLVLARLRLIALRWQGGMPDAHEAHPHVVGPGAIAVREATSVWGPDMAGEGGHDEQDEWADPTASGRGMAQAERLGSDAPGGDELGSDAPGGVGLGSDPPGSVPPTWLGPGSWVRLVGVLVTIVAIGAAALLVTSWPREQPAAASAPSELPSADPFADPFLAASPSPSPSVMVHVVGEVRDPGVVELPAGSRVVDALRAAGGLRRGGELGTTNLARVLADGERIEVGGQEAAVAGGVPGPAGDSGGLLDLNTATAEQLDALPGIGPVTAAKILAWRSTHNRFSVIDELAEVPGIGPKTLADLRPLVRV